MSDSREKNGRYGRLLIGAPASGTGKTLITCGLLECFRRRGMNPMAFKCGPDYIDPMFHRYVLGIPGRNLDTFFLSKRAVRESLFSAMDREKAGIAVLEGVMGYYDGIGGTSLSASTWEVGAATETPAVLVLNCRGISLSAAAVAAGFCRFVENSGIRGLILNRVSPMYYARIAPAIEERTGLPVLGYLPESEDYRIESRHLGLFIPEEVEALRERIGRLADQMEKTVDMDGFIRLSRQAPPPEKTEERRECGGKEERLPGSKRTEKPGRRLRIGVARDEAFCFYYQENLELLENMGGTPVYFSPLRDRKLPENLDGLILGGGYPENYGRELSENGSMRESVGNAAAKGLPFLAECGGFLYLHRTLEGSDGERYPMAGVYALDAFRTGKLGRFGYVTLCPPSGPAIRGHEFHYWESSDPGEDWYAEKPSPDGKKGRGWRCMHDTGAQIGGFPHLYYASCPEFLTKWLSCCRAYREEREKNEG